MSLSPQTTSKSESKNYVLGIIYSLIGSLAISYISVATNKMKGVHFLVITFFLSISTQSVCIVLILAEYFVSGRVPF